MVHRRIEGGADGTHDESHDDQQPENEPRGTPAHGLGRLSDPEGVDESRCKCLEEAHRTKCINGADTGTPFSRLGAFAESYTEQQHRISRCPRSRLLRRWVEHKLILLLRSLQGVPKEMYKNGHCRNFYR